MKTLDPQREALIARIEATFPDPGFPERRTCPHRCDECDALDRVFQGSRWHEIAERDMLQLSGASALLSDEALSYFIPGLMVGCLREPEEADVTTDFLAYTFLDRPQRHALLEALPPEQRKAIYGYLEWWLGWDEYNAEWVAKYERLVQRISPD